MLKQKRENRLVHCLVCWKCHGRMGPNHYLLENAGATCGACGDRNPLANLKRIRLDFVTSEYEIIVNFGPDTHKNHAMKVHGLHLDAKTVLSSWRSVENEETLIRTLVYLGATDEQMKDYRRQRRQWGQGSVHVRILPNKKNLLGLDWKLL